MEAKQIDVGDIAALVHKEKLDYGLSPFVVKILFVCNGQLVTVCDSFKTETEMNGHFEKVDKELVKDYIENWKIAYDL